MTITYSLAPIPKWYIADLTGKPLGGGYLATFSNLNHTQLNPVFQDNAGQFPWPYVTIPNVGSLGILFDENGSQGPFYWQVDSANPDELYYIEVYNSNGNLQWTVDDFSPNTGGGGGDITEVVNIQNLITNNVMWRNIGSTAMPTNTTFLKIAPGAHAGLAQTPSNAGPDICFIKNNTAANDQIQFLKFPLGSNLLTGDVTPVDYFNYTCGNSPSGETQKLIQFPITKGVQNLNNQAVTVSIWANLGSGPGNQLNISWMQFFGDGAGATVPSITPIAMQTIVTGWNKYTFTTTIPNVTGSTLGPCGNDGLFLQIGLPLGNPTNISFTKPSVWLGNVAPTQDYTTYDMIDAVINAPRTGYITQGYDLVAPFGYLLMDDGTIGSSSSGATSNGGIGANTNTFPLYNWLWNNVSSPSSNMWCPVTGGLGASAVADFIANKPLQLQAILGRALASAGAGAGLTARVLGQFLGEETHTLTINEMPSHNHPPLSPQTTISGRGSGSSPYGSGSGDRGDEPTTGNTGGGAAHNNMQPTSFLNFYIKL